MRCPYPDCQKDYNDESWTKEYDGFVDPDNFEGSINARELKPRVYLVTRLCRFCHKYFHEIYVGTEKFDAHYNLEDRLLEYIGSYPTRVSRFSSKKIPSAVLATFHEAERCISIGAKTGASACLRKTIYALCDDLGTQGRYYKDKINALPLHGDYQELLKQIKWLGDNETKPDGREYSPEMLQRALEILPVVIDKLYEEDEKIKEVTALLQKVKSKTPHSSP